MRFVAERFCRRRAASAKGDRASRLGHAGIAVRVEDYDLVSLFEADQVRPVAFEPDGDAHEAQSGVGVRCSQRRFSDVGRETDRLGLLGGLI